MRTPRRGITTELPSCVDFGDRLGLPLQVFSESDHCDQAMELSFNFPCGIALFDPARCHGRKGVRTGLIGAVCLCVCGAISACSCHHGTARFLSSRNSDLRAACSGFTQGPAVSSGHCSCRTLLKPLAFGRDFESLTRIKSKTETKCRSTLAFLPQ